MYENFRHLYNPSYFPSLEEKLMKRRKDCAYYGKKFSIKKDGYFNEYMEFGNDFLLGRRRNADRYICYRLENEIGDVNVWLRCYINIDDPDEYMVVTRCIVGKPRNLKVQKVLPEI